MSRLRYFPVTEQLIAGAPLVDVYEEGVVAKRAIRLSRTPAPSPYASPDDFTSGLSDFCKPLAAHAEIRLSNIALRSIRADCN